MHRKRSKEYRFESDTQVFLRFGWEGGGRLEIMMTVP